MTKKKYTIHDPDFGLIEIPEPPPMSDKDWNAMRARIRRRLLRDTVYKAGETYTCPECRKRTLVAASDLNVELLRGRNVVIFSNLKGARCGNCNAEALEPREIVRLEDAADDLAQADEEARVTRIGKGTVGTYWPKAVERRLKLKPGDHLVIRLLTSSSALMRVEHAGSARPSSTRRVSGIRVNEPPVRKAGPIERPGPSIIIKSGQDGDGRRRRAKLDEE